MYYGRGELGWSFIAKLPVSCVGENGCQRKLGWKHKAPVKERAAERGYRREGTHEDRDRDTHLVSGPEGEKLGKLSLCDREGGGEKTKNKVTKLLRLRAQG